MGWSLKHHRPTSYSSFAKLNPFSDERHTQMQDFYNPQTWKAGTGTGRTPEPPPKHGYHKGHKSPGMSHSQSEGNIDFRSRAIKDHNFRVGKTFEGAAGDHYNRSSEDTNASSSLSRGRTLTRTPSPVKTLEDIKEDQASRSPPNPTKRSRSPFKQMFGEKGWLGRSTSMNELPNEKYRKTGIKHWGGKIKQRVENLVGLRTPPRGQVHWLTRTDRRCVEGVKAHTNDSPPARIALQVSPEDQIQRLSQSSYASKALLRNGAYGLRHSQSIPQRPA